MTFLEALQWMSESEENMTVRNQNLYFKVKENMLLSSADKNYWVRSYDSVSRHMDCGWSKSEPAPEEVEVVAYFSDNGALSFAVSGSEKDKAYSRTKHWRKVKVRFLDVLL